MVTAVKRGRGWADIGSGLECGVIVGIDWNMVVTEKRFIPVMIFITLNPGNT